MSEKRLTLCCGMPAYWESLSFVGGSAKMTFGQVPVCSKCQKIVGDYKLMWNAPKAVKDHFNGTSWLMMLEFHPRPPFNFEKGADILIPESYVGRMKSQPKFTEEEVPF